MSYFTKHIAGHTVVSNIIVTQKNYFVGWDWVTHY